MRRAAAPGGRAFWKRGVGSGIAALPPAVESHEAGPFPCPPGRRPRDEDGSGNLLHFDDGPVVAVTAASTAFGRLESGNTAQGCVIRRPQRERRLSPRAVSVTCSARGARDGPGRPRAHSWRGSGRAGGTGLPPDPGPGVGTRPCAGAGDRSHLHSRGLRVVTLHAPTSGGRTQITASTLVTGTPLPFASFPVPGGRLTSGHVTSHHDSLNRDFRDVTRSSRGRSRRRSPCSFRKQVRTAAPREAARPAT